MQKVDLDIVDKDGKVLREIRYDVCDARARLSQYPLGYKWVRYVIIKDCKYNDDEIRRWCNFVTRCGFKCHFSNEIVRPQVFSSFGKNEATDCYTITLYPKDYNNNDMHFLIGNTVVRMINFDECLENIPKIVEEINIRMNPLQKLLLACYTLPSSNHAPANKNLYNYDIHRYETRPYKLLKTKEFVIKDGVQKSMSIPLLGKNLETVMKSINEKDYKTAYNYLNGK